MSHLPLYNVIFLLLTCKREMQILALHINTVPKFFLGTILKKENAVVIQCLAKVGLQL